MHCIRLRHLKHKIGNKLLTRCFFKDINSNESKSFINIENEKSQNYFTNKTSKVNGIVHEISKHDVYIDSNNETLGEIIDDYQYFPHFANNNILFLRKALNSQCRQVILDLNDLCNELGKPVSLVAIKFTSPGYIGIVLDDHMSNTNMLCLKDMDNNILTLVNFPAYLHLSDVDMSLGSDGNFRFFFLIAPNKLRPSQIYRTTYAINKKFLFGYAPKMFSNRIRHVKLKNEDLTLVLQEDNPSYFLSFSKAKGDDCVVIHHQSKKSSKVSLLSLHLSDHMCPPWVLFPVTPGVKAFVTRAFNQFHIAINLDSKQYLRSSSACRIHTHAHESAHTHAREHADDHRASSPTCASDKDGSDRLDGDSASDDMTLLVCNKTVNELKQSAKSSNAGLGLYISDAKLVWPPQLDQTDASCDGSHHLRHSVKYIIDDYDILHDRIVIYGKKYKKFINDKDEKSSYGDSTNNSHVQVIVQLLERLSGKLIREWTGKELEHIIGLEPYVITPHANINKTSASVAFTLSSPVLPGCLAVMNLLDGRLQIISGLETDKLPFSKDMISIRKHIVSTVDEYNVTMVEIRLTKLSHRDNGFCENTDVNEPCPTIMFGYGSYGICCPMHYRPEVAAMLSRGWRVVFAHIRGGGERGRAHHNYGKERNKWNSFRDFADCAKYLIQMGYTTPNLLCASVSSAGGLVGGVMYAYYSHLFAAIVMRNPFLDIYRTMQDISSDLTVHEYDEWGKTHTDTAAASHHRDLEDVKRNLMFIKSYSPCSILDKSQNSIYKLCYPAVLLTVGLSDNRVHPSESMHWVHKIRSTTPHRGGIPAPVLIRLLPGVGHEGSCENKDHVMDCALEIAFLESAVQI